MCYLKTKSLEIGRGGTQKQEDSMHRDSVLKRSMLQRIVQTLKDIIFKRRAIVNVELVSLMLIASSGSCVILSVVPYAVVLAVLCLTQGVTGKSKLSSWMSSMLTVPLMAGLLIDLPLTYLYQTSHSIERPSYLMRIMGLGLDTQSGAEMLSFFNFLMKCGLLVIQCAKLKYSYSYCKDCSDALKSLKLASTQADGNLAKLFLKRKSMSKTIFKPFAMLALSFVSMIYAYTHTSLLLMCFMPILIYGILNESNFAHSLAYKYLVNLFLVTIALQIMASQLFTIVNNYQIVSQGAQLTQGYITFINTASYILGVSKKVQQQRFGAPIAQWTIDYLFLILIAFFASLRSGSFKDLVESPDEIEETQQNAKGRLDEEDYLTIIPEEDPQSQSESGKFSPARGLRFKFGTQSQKSTPRKTTFERFSIEEPAPLKSQEVHATVRSRLRKAFFAGANLLFPRYAEVRNLLDIHYFKVALCALFFASTIGQPTVIKLALFLLFMILCLVKQCHKLILKLTISLTVGVLLAIYGIEVFSLKSRDILNIPVLQLIGLAQDDTKSQISLYLPYLLLLYILSNANFKIQKLESSESAISNDKFSRFIDSYQIELITIALIVECSLLPINAINVVLLIIMSIMCWKYFRSISSEHSPHQFNLGNIITALKWVSAFLLLIKYFFQLLQYYLLNGDYQNVAQDMQLQYQSLIGNMPYLERMLGVENSNSYFYQVKMFSLALLIALSNLTYMGLSEAERPKKLSDPVLPVVEKKLMDRLIGLTREILYVTLIPLPCFLTMMYSTLNPSLLGLLLLTVATHQCIFNQRLSFKVLGPFLACTAFLVYLTQFFQPILPSWLLWALGISDTQKPILDIALIPLFGLIISCYLQQEFTSKKLGQPSEEENQLASDQISNDHLQQAEPKTAKYSQITNHITPSIHKFGLVFLQTILTLSIIQKSNFLSLIQLIVLWKYLKATDKSLSPLLGKVQFIWSIMLSIELTMMIDNDDIRTIKNKLFSGICGGNSDCVQDFQSWFSLSDVKVSWLVVDSFQLIFTVFIKDVVAIPKNEDEAPSTKSSQMKLLYKYFNYIVITYSALYAISTAQQQILDAISIGYLLLAFYSLVSMKKYYAKRPYIAWLNYLRIYSFLVLVIRIVFQTPLLICPYPNSVAPAGKYLSYSSCINLGNTYGSFSWLERQETLDLFAQLSPFKQFYFILAHSLGLEKSSSIQLGFILLLTLIEIQNFIVNDKGFKVYFASEYSDERLVDRKLRAFVYVENYHLKTLWAYKAIKEEIRILHQRLLRITQQIKNSDHSKHLISDFEEGEDHHRDEDYMDDGGEHINLLDSANERHTHQSDDSQNSDMFLVREFNESAKESEEVTNPAFKIMLDNQFNAVMNRHANDIENLALDLLFRPGNRTPVVPLKLFMAAFKNFLQNEFQKKLNLRDTSPQSEMLEPFQIKIDHRQIEEYLLQIANKLQKQVLLKSKMDLYNQERMGLSIALQRGSDSLLKDLEDPLAYTHFFRHLFEVSKHEQELRVMSDDDKDVQNSNNTDPNQEISSQEDQLLIISTLRPPISSRNNNWLVKLNRYVRKQLWERMVDHQLCYSIIGNQSEGPKESLYTISLIRIIGCSILSQSSKLCILMMILNFVINADLLSLFLALTTFTYSFISIPIPPKGYWKMVIGYKLAVIALKCVYQLPLFCSSPAYSIQLNSSSCNHQVMSPEILIRRFDYILGIHKFDGPASYPRDNGVLLGIAPDVLVLLSVIILMYYQTQVGIWDYVKVMSNVHDTPSFKSSSDHSQDDDYLSFKAQRKRTHLQIYRESTIQQKIRIRVLSIWRKVVKFIKRVLPVFMKDHIKNRDMRRSEEEPLMLHNIKRVKPGKDYFAQSFTLLVLIFVFNLFFFRQLTQAASQANSSNTLQLQLQRFSIPQVAILFFLLLLMMVERMLYRARQFDSSHRDGHGLKIGKAQSGILGRHQLTIKFAIHVFLVILVHVQLGFIVPRHFSNNSNSIITLSTSTPLLIYYLLFVAYFIASALQIKHGYPQAAFKAPFLPGDNSQFTVWAFRLYKAVPFLWEMRVVVDWTVTAATCLDLSQWFKLDDAFNGLFLCQLQHWERANHTTYSQRSWVEKVCQGFCFAFGLILVILAPILLFSGINPIMVTNPVLHSTMMISLSLPSEQGVGYQLLNTQAFDIQAINATDLQEMVLSSNSDQNGAGLNSEDLDIRNMQKMQYSQYSATSWQISPPSLQKFIDDYYYYLSQPSIHYFDVTAKYSFKRSSPIGNEVTSYESTAHLKVTVLQPIIDMLDLRSKGSSPSNESTIQIENLFPQMLRLGETQQAHLIDDIAIKAVKQANSTQSSIFNSASLTLRTDSNQLYWTYEILGTNSSTPQRSMQMTVYNEQVIGSLFGTALQLSVVGLYATIVIAIGRFLRLAFDRISQRVIYEEMDPDTTEQLFEICEGIYIAQLEGDLIKEKKLYDLLIRMYRSPETLIKIKRHQDPLHYRPHSQYLIREDNLQPRNNYLPTLQRQNSH